MIDEKKVVIDLREENNPYSEEARAFCKTVPTLELIKEFYRLKRNLKNSIDGLSFIIEEMRERMEGK